MKYIMTVLVPFFVFWSGLPVEGLMLPLDEYLKEQMAKVQTKDPYLRSIYEHQLKARYDLQRVSGDQYKEAYDAFLNTPRDAAETKYILEALNNAYQKEPKDWGTIATALEVAAAGTDEAQVVEICIKILEHVREIPDDMSDIVFEASQYLVLKRQLEYVELVTHCIYADYVGVLDEKSAASLKKTADRNLFRFKAISVLQIYLTPELLLAVLGQVVKDHPIEMTDDPLSWKYSIAIKLNNTIKSCELILRDGPLPPIN